jgi:NADH-quinone oxidoreductase subunit N
MSTTDLIAILPLLVLAATAVLLLLAIAIRRSHTTSFSIATAGLILACASVTAAARGLPHPVTALFIVDGYALFYQGLILLSALTVCLLSHGYLQTGQLERRDEYYLLLLTATLGAAALVATSHYASFFLSLETLSLSLIALIAYPRGQDRPLEAGIKYLILSGVSSAFLLFGIAILYAGLGTLSFSMVPHLPAHPALPAPSLLAGIALVLVGMGFKLSLVPFHMWAPDIYEGAPAPVTAFVAVVSKSAVFALLLRFFTATGSFDAAPLTAVLGAVAVLSMLAGNLLALLQTNVKRILAYSSIAHLGYALVAFLVGGSFAIEAVSVYLVAYAVMTLGAFAVVTLLASPDAARDADLIEDYRGLFWLRPGLSLAFAAALLSLAGIPLTVGFIAKFYAVASGVDGHHGVLLGTLVAGSIIGLYYYLRIIVAMAAPAADIPGTAAPAARRIRSAPLGHAVLAALVLLLIGLGAYPTPLLTLIRATASVVAR